MGGLLRVGVYTLAVVMSISVLTFVPSTHNLFTSLGARTLYVYLLHGFFIQYFREADLFYVNDFVDLIGLGLIAFGIVIFLSKIGRASCRERVLITVVPSCIKETV